jgi:hypothetical protein
MKKVVDMLKSPENGFGRCRSPPCDVGFGVAGICVMIVPPFSKTTHELPWRAPITIKLRASPVTICWRFDFK